MTPLNLEGSKEISNLCKDIASLTSKICCISHVNKNGRTIENLVPDDRVFTNLTGQELEMLFMQRKLQTAMNREFDEKIGTMNHIVIERNTVLEFIFPFYDGIILVVTRPEIPVKKFVKKISKMILEFEFGEVKSLR